MGYLEEMMGIDKRGGSKGERIWIEIREWLKKCNIYLTGVSEERMGFQERMDISKKSVGY